MRLLLGHLPLPFSGWFPGWWCSSRWLTLTSIWGHKHLKLKDGESKPVAHTHIQMLSLGLMSRTVLMFITDIPPKADVNFYCEVSHSGQNIREEWTSQGCRGARPPFANESAACLQIARWKGSGSDFFQNSGSYFLSSSSCEHTYLPNFKLTAKRFFGEEKKKATKPDNCAKTQEAAALISL